MGDTDFPTVMANGGGKPFLDTYIKKRQSYEQKGTNIPNYLVLEDYEKQSGEPAKRRAVIRIG
tara:strand:- start:512 stop:700 length:189 start_codon:yes stop_codon:yes gene_type:complete